MKGRMKMNCKVEKTENANEVKLEFTIEAEKFEQGMKKVYQKNQPFPPSPAWSGKGKKAGFQFPTAVPSGWRIANGALPAVSVSVL